jgi:hypothetical protein
MSVVYTCDCAASILLPEIGTRIFVLARCAITSVRVEAANIVMFWASVASGILPIGIKAVVKPY